MGKAVPVLGAAIVLAVSPLAAAKEGKWQRLYWPQLALSKDRGERVEAIEVEMSCGRFRAVSNIPEGWSFEVVGPSSEVTHLRASADHGASMLWSLRELDGSIGIAVKDSSCFTISATVSVSQGGRGSKQYKLSRTELRLRP